MLAPLPIEHLTKGTNIILGDESNEHYHANDRAVGSTQLRAVLKSPASFYSAFTGETLDEPSKSLHFGSAVHCYVLEPERFARWYFQVPDFGDLRSSKNREIHSHWKQQIPSGAFFLDEEDYQKVIAIGSAIAKHPDAKVYLTRGVAEKSHYYRDPETNILCKFRPDFLSSKDVALVDLKTTEKSCHERVFTKTIWDYRYDFQLAMYGQGVKEIYGREIQKYIFIVVEKKPPYEVAVYELDPSAIERGYMDYRQCLATLKDCLLKNEWPGYQKSMQMINLPNWVY